jgi:hypothetical protein
MLGGVSNYDKTHVVVGCQVQQGLECTVEDSTICDSHEKTSVTSSDTESRSFWRKEVLAPICVLMGS